MKSTAQMVSKLFDSDTIRAKVSYAPLGVPLPERWQHHEESEHINLLFTNSCHQLTGNFFLRGGLDVLEAFAVLHERYPHLRLTLRTHLPGLEVRHHRIIEKGWVRVIDRFSSAREMEELLRESHIFLLPAARVHIVSLLQAMAHGLAVVASDGWGFEEYVNHGRNSLVVKGRYGKVSWVDEKVGMLRENYTPMYQPDPKVVRGIVKAVSILVENRSLRKRLGRTARRDVETTYNLERWNSGLKEAFDKALRLHNDQFKMTNDQEYPFVIVRS
jgi:glycosyltransferase involved in cell wall biosynthesis